MGYQRKIKGSVIGLVGYLLSPLSWWNDLVVNVPLAVGFAWLVSLAYPPAFDISVAVGYWLTNIVGLVMLHYGARQVLTEKPPDLSRRELLKALLVSILYTLLIVLLVRLKIIGPLTLP
jgi:hypothetical protein